MAGLGAKDGGTYRVGVKQNQVLRRQDRGEASVLEGDTQKLYRTLGNEANVVTCLFNVTVERVLQAYFRSPDYPGECTCV